MAKIIIVGSECEGNEILKIIAEKCQKNTSVKIEKYSHKDLADSFVHFGNAIKKLSVSFEDLIEAEKAFKQKQPFDELKSKYINKPRHNFKRR